MTPTYLLLATVVKLRPFEQGRKKAAAAAALDGQAQGKGRAKKTDFGATFIFRQGATKRGAITILENEQCLYWTKFTVYISGVSKIIAVRIVGK